MLAEQMEMLQKTLQSTVFRTGFAAMKRTALLRMFDLKYSLRKWIIRLGRLAIYLWDLCLAAGRHWFLSGPAPLKMLLLSDGINAHSECQFDPIFRHRRMLRNEFGLVVSRTHARPLRVRPSSRFRSYDLVGLKFNYKTQPDEVMRASSAVAGSMRSDAKLIYCDGNDELTIQWPGLLRICDLYWKKHAFREVSLYKRRFRGTTNLTEYCIPDGQEDKCDECQDALVIPRDEDLRKLFVGSSVALDRKIAILYPLLSAESQTPTFASRPYDAVLRANVPENWMGKLRRPAADAISRMQDRLKVLLPTDRVPPHQYAEEMRASKICVSPFGYGEICWRDFEAVAYGCLLVKPDMAHVRTRPDVYRPFETYIPVAWDFSDLEEKLLHYVANAEESANMVARARQVLAEALEPRWFVMLFRELLMAAAPDNFPQFHRAT